jgi:uncharacterized protein (TIGR02117 family)
MFRHLGVSILVRLNSQTWSASVRRKFIIIGVKWAALGFGSLCALFLIAAWIGSSWPVNSDWKPAREGVTIYVATNGFHSGLILPVSAEGQDWSLIVRATDLPDPSDSGNWLLFGWGDREFYLNTPNWSDVRPGTVVAAFLGSDQTLVHVDHLKDPRQVPGARAVRLSSAQYRRLTAFIRASMALDAQGRGVATPGYGSLDTFYAARGRYSAVRTCNVWTGEALAAAGVRVGRWTPFSEGVMRWFGE